MALFGPDKAFNELKFGPNKAIPVKSASPSVELKNNLPLTGPPEGVKIQKQIHRHYQFLQKHGYQLHKWLSFLLAMSRFDKRR